MSQQFIIQHSLGNGAHAKVFKAIDSKLDRAVAIKFIEPSIQQTLKVIDQAKALARANHANVVHVYDVIELIDPDTDSISNCIVMEYLDGNSLQEYIDTNTIQAQTAFEIGCTIINAVEHLHSIGIVHGDLHSGNVLMAGDTLKIIDILYLDSLAALSSIKQKDKIIRDCIALSFLLRDMLHNTDLSMEVVSRFDKEVRNAPSLQVIKQTFIRLFEELDQLQELTYGNQEIPRYFSRSYSFDINYEDESYSFVLTYKELFMIFAVSCFEAIKDDKLKLAIEAGIARNIYEKSLGNVDVSSVSVDSYFINLLMRDFEGLSLFRKPRDYWYLTEEGKTIYYQLRQIFQ